MPRYPEWPEQRATDVEEEYFAVAKWIKNTADAAYFMKAREVLIGHVRDAFSRISSTPNLNSLADTLAERTLACTALVGREAVWDILHEKLRAIRPARDQPLVKAMPRNPAEAIADAMTANRPNELDYQSTDPAFCLLRETLERVFPGRIADYVKGAFRYKIGMIERTRGRPRDIEG